MLGEMLDVCEGSVSLQVTVPELEPCQVHDLDVGPDEEDFTVSLVSSFVDVSAELRDGVTVSVGFVASPIVVEVVNLLVREQSSELGSK